jgi:GT2 family glycosyltransferase
MSAPALVVIPVYMRTPDDYNVTVQTVESVRRTQSQTMTMLVDDCSPAEGLWDELRSRDWQGAAVTFLRNDENSGFSRTVNRGLRWALEHNHDAVLLNADVDILTKGWLRVFQEQKDSQGRPASVVGPLLLYPNGLIQSAGTYFSMLTRSWDHRYRFAPGALPEAKLAFACPVTGAFQYIRHECLTSVGLYDEGFRMGYEDVEHNVRVFESGRECIYQPRVIAVHHESMFRGRADEKLNTWQQQSAALLQQKLATANLTRYVPPIV